MRVCLFFLVTQAPILVWFESTIMTLVLSAAELGRNPVSKHQIQPEYGDEQADAERDG